MKTELMSFFLTYHVIVVLQKVFFFCFFYILVSYIAIPKCTYIMENKYKYFRFLFLSLYFIDKATVETQALVVH